MSLPPILQNLSLPVICSPMFIAGGAEKKVWRDIWSAGQGVGQIKAILPVAEVVSQLRNEYTAARQRLQFG